MKSSWPFFFVEILHHVWCLSILLLLFYKNRTSHMCTYFWLLSSYLDIIFVPASDFREREKYKSTKEVPRISFAAVLWRSLSGPKFLYNIERNVTVRILSPHIAIPREMEKWRHERYRSGYSHFHKSSLLIYRVILDGFLICFNI